MKTYYKVALLIVLVLISIQANANGSILITNTKVIDSEFTLEKADVLIIDGIIEKVEPNIKVEASIKLIEGTNTTLIPSFVATHNHLHMPGATFLGEAGARLYLAGGVTTMQTTGAAEPLKELQLKQDIEQGKAAGPDIVATGPYFTGPDGNAVMLRITDTEAIDKEIGQWVDRGVSWFKVYRHTTETQLKTIIESAHKRGAKVTGHLCSITMQQAAELGIDAIEHGFIHAYDFAEDKSAGECGGSNSYRSSLDIQGEALEQLHETLIANEVAISSTPSIFEAQTPNTQINPAYKTYLAPHLLERAENYLQRREKAGDSWYFKQEWLERTLEHDLLFLKRGGLLTIGPDPGLHSIPGFADRRNFELLIEGGFTIQEAIQAMSANGAKLLGFNDRGYIKESYRADLIIVKGDLEITPQNINDIKLVIKNGAVYTPKDLRKGLEGQLGKGSGE
ncbi:amidohydrolase family protein [Kangiella sp.]|uniref:amidohydrolase family protein n=1 Tax=Kangiella sp. TaxID=1920245 RepID=UPI003A92B7B0